MAAEPPYSIVEARLPDDLPAIHQVRRAVFVIEQGIPEHLEWDGRDECCSHVLARDAQRQPVGTGRIDTLGRIGRMAVLASWRSRGVGGDLLSALLALAASQGRPEVVVHAQCSVAGFYRKAGFFEQGPTFDEAGIEHQLMVKVLPGGNNR
jgi:predicted GNAT family N-acyltransferase